MKICRSKWLLVLRLPILITAEMIEVRCPFTHLNKRKISLCWVIDAYNMKANRKSIYSVKCYRFNGYASTRDVFISFISEIYTAGRLWNVTHICDKKFKESVSFLYVSIELIYKMFKVAVFNEKYSGTIWEIMEERYNKRNITYLILTDFLQHNH